MTDKEILALFSRKTAQGKAGMAMYNGSTEWVGLNSTREVGKYYGNPGSIRRSRKGRTYRLPNGRRWYPHPDSEYGTEVIAYLVKS